MCRSPCLDAALTAAALLAGAVRAQQPPSDEALREASQNPVANYNVVRPDDLPSALWSLRLQVQLLFPR